MKKLKQIWHQLNLIWNLPTESKSDYIELSRALTELEMKLAERTTVHADIGYRGATQVIVVGRYRNKDYVRAFNIRHDSIGELIEILRREEKNANVGRFDMIGGIDFSAVYPYETFR